MPEFNPVAVKAALERENQSENSQLVDFRQTNGAGTNRYATLINNAGVVTQVKFALDKGASKNSIFEFLRSEGFFDENASYAAFVRALNRAIERLENPHGKKKEKSSETKNQTTRVAASTTSNGGDEFKIRDREVRI